MFEAGWVDVERRAVTVPRMPAGFAGMCLAFLTDIHHGPYTDVDYVRQIVRTTNLLDPDLIVLGGDYSLREAKYVGPCFEALRIPSGPARRLMACSAITTTGTGSRKRRKG